jgi:hypothetical protein
MLHHSEREPARSRLKRAAAKIMARPKLGRDSCGLGPRVERPLPGSSASVSAVPAFERSSFCATTSTRLLSR